MRPPKPDFAFSINPPLVARFRHPEAKDDDDKRIIQSEVLYGVQLICYLPDEPQNLQMPSIMFCLSPDGDGAIINAQAHPGFLGFETMLNAMGQVQAAVEAAERKLGGLFIPPGAN